VLLQILGLQKPNYGFSDESQFILVLPSQHRYRLLQLLAMVLNGTATASPLIYAFFSLELSQSRFDVIDIDLTDVQAEVIERVDFY
jgi:hypothetical protein